MTPAGHERLHAELRRIRGVDRPSNVKEIEAALEHGDLRENAEYHAAKERQATIEGRMRYVEQRLSRAQVIDPATIKSETVGFGATVRVLDVDTDQELEYVLVGEHEADADRGRISILSPIARSLLGKRSDDIAQLRLPKGDREFEILGVTYKAIE